MHKAREVSSNIEQSTEDMPKSAPRDINKCCGQIDEQVLGKKAILGAGKIAFLLAY